VKSRRLLLSLLACLAVGNGDSHAAEPANIELPLLKSVTVTEEQFLLGAKDGQPVTLAAFAKNGDPNHASLPNWPTFDVQKRATMVFDVPSRVVTDPNREERAFFHLMPLR
jgi:hypothetical protein